VTGLGGEDDGGEGEVRGRGDVLRGTGIGGYSDVLDQSSEGDERLDVGVWAATSAVIRSSNNHDSQVVSALGNSVSCKRTSKQANVLALVCGDLGEPSADPIRVTGSSKVLL
jgi:hypothetical protein